MSDLHSRYEAAERLLPHRWKDLVFSGQVTPNWIQSGDRFWYVNRTVGGTQFVLVDPEGRTREPLFDHRAVAESLSAALGRSVDPGDLPIGGLDIRDGGLLHLYVEGKTWLWNASTCVGTQGADPAPDRFAESVSPDGR